MIENKDGLYKMTKLSKAEKGAGRNKADMPLYAFG